MGGWMTHMNFKQIFEKVYLGNHLTIEESKAALLCILEGSCEASQISAFLTALHMKGETCEELAGFALAMRQMAVSVEFDGQKTLDTCGTGGDRKGSFNISTITAFVVAGCGIPVAKHGNRAASSLCGSADLLEALGIRYRLKPDEAQQSLADTKFAFLFAPDYHPATSHVAPIRRLMGVPTLFNYLGPLTNPARPLAQLIGVFDRKGLELMASAIRLMEPQKKVTLLHSDGGWDEATPCGEFTAFRNDSGFSKMSSADFGIPFCNEKDLAGDDAEGNARIAMSILHGELGARRDTVLINAALAIQVYHPHLTNHEALTEAKQSIDSRAALHVVRTLQDRFPLGKS
jgi:anthranilate phosphoribosyltransferase